MAEENVEEVMIQNYGFRTLLFIHRSYCKLYL